MAARQESKELLRAPEAATLLGISPATLAKWRVNGKGPSYHKIGHLVLYHRSDIQRWLQACRVAQSDVQLPSA